MSQITTSDGTIPNKPPVHADPEEIREAILARVPEDPNFTRDIKIDTGMADIALRWRTLRFSTMISIQSLTPDQIADIVEKEFMAWLLRIITIHPNPEFQKVNPKAATVVNDMREWAIRKGYATRAELNA